MQLSGQMTKGTTASIEGKVWAMKTNMVTNGRGSESSSIMKHRERTKEVQRKTINQEFER